MKLRRKIQQGFTLLEILAALAIASIGLVAVSNAVGSNLISAQEAESRLIASWVASNRLSELRVLGTWPSAQQSDSEETMAGREWHITQTVKTTADSEQRRVDVKVYADENRERLVANLFGFLTKP